MSRPRTRSFGSLAGALVLGALIGAGGLFGAARVLGFGLRPTQAATPARTFCEPGSPGSAASSPSLETAAVPAALRGACKNLVAVRPKWEPDLEARVEPLELPRISSRFERRVDFWAKVWGEHPSHTWVFFDERRPSFVHGVVDCRDLFAAHDEARAEKACDQRLGKERSRIKRRLYQQRKRPSKATLDALDPSRKVARRLARTAHRNVRVVEGRADKLREANARAAPHLARLEAIFQTVGVPKELTRLAWVESLFRPDAVSRSGAVGAYQFMEPTGRVWLTIRGDVDERKDPERAGWAAALYLKQLYDRFDSWPLALTAYNTGPTRMARLIKRQRTRNLDRIARSLTTEKGFAFDGQNYYASFAGVMRAIEALEREVEQQEMGPPEAVDAPELVAAHALRAAPRHAARLERAMSLQETAACLGMSPDELARENPALGVRILRGQRPIPKGYVIGAPDTVEALARVAREEDDGA